MVVSDFIGVSLLWRFGLALTTAPIRRLPQTVITQFPPQLAVVLDRGIRSVLGKRRREGTKASGTS
jgi:hypothetical protein